MRPTGGLGGALVVPKETREIVAVRVCTLCSDLKWRHEPNFSWRESEKCLLFTRIYDGRTDTVPVLLLTVMRMMRTSFIKELRLHSVDCSYCSYLSSTGTIIV